MARHRIAVLAPADVTPFGLGVAVEAFGTPRPREDLGYDVEVCTAHPGEASVTNALFGVRILHGLEAIDRADTLVVLQVDLSTLPVEPEVIAAVRRAHRRGARLVSFCTGAFVLAAAGVLDGRRATTHWYFARRLARAHPLIQVDPDVLYVDEGQVLTSAGAAAAIDLSLHIIGKDHGAHVARQVARAMVVAPHRDGGQAQFVMTPVPDLSGQWDGVSRAMQHAVESLDRELGLAELAAVAVMSPRNFSRRFREVTGTTPMRWLNHQRLSRVRELLEETDMTIERIAVETGHGSAVTLRQRFAQDLHISPTAYRRAFRLQAGAGRHRATRTPVGSSATPRSA